MKKVYLFSLFLPAILMACHDEQDYFETIKEQPRTTFHLMQSDYDGETTPATKSIATPYDRMEHYIMDADGQIVTNIRTAYNPSTSEIVAEGLHEGSYVLLTLGIRGDYTSDKANIHRIQSATDTWLTFPDTLDQPLRAEYFYSRTPFHVSLVETEDGRHEVTSLQRQVVLRRIVGRIDFNFTYNNQYVRTALTEQQLELQEVFCYTSFSADSTFDGRSQGYMSPIDLTNQKSFLLMPTVASTQVDGNIKMETRRYTGKCLKQEYQFENIIVSPNRLEQVNTRVQHPDDHSGTLFFTPKAYEEGKFSEILQDDEPAEIYADKNQRSFHTGHPLQVTFTEEGQLHVRFYSPRNVTQMKIMARIPAAGEEYIDIAYFDTIPAFADIYADTPLASQASVCQTESGKLKEIPILTTEELQKAEFKLVSEDFYWRKLKKIEHEWNVSFGLYGGDPTREDGGPSGNWMGIRPVHCREVVAVLLNFTYMIDMPEHEQILKENIDILYDDNKQPVTPEKVLAQMRIERSLVVGLVYSKHGVVGLGGGNVWGVYQQAYVQHYTNPYSCELMFHELGHVMGYGHASSFTYGPWAQNLMNNFYVSNLEKFPIDSPKYLNTATNPNLYKSF